MVSETTPVQLIESKMVSETTSAQLIESKMASEAIFDTFLEFDRKWCRHQMALTKLLCRLADLQTLPPQAASEGGLAKSATQQRVQTSADLVTVFATVSSSIIYAEGQAS
ncbi:MAG TPA: hypothetical protein VKR06_14655 [Ktedonosporobacter sp.]|nr:hypothetical protein [Ktedonosporobacter sp.]